MAQATQQALAKTSPVAAPADPRKTLSEYVRTRQLAPDTMPALAAVVSNVRNDMYLSSEAIRFLDKNEGAKLDLDTKRTLFAFKAQIDDATKFIPLWVKVAVAIALGLGTMFGWKRIVVTVGEKIGKTHLTYAQGASAELVAMAWVLTLPVAMLLSGSLYWLFTRLF